MIGITGSGIGVLGCETTQATRHVQQIGNAYVMTSIVDILPFLNWGRLPEIINPLLYEKGHKRSGDALSHRPAGETRSQVHSRFVPLRNKLPFVNNSKGLC